MGCEARAKQARGTAQHRVDMGTSEPATFQNHNTVFIIHNTVLTVYFSSPEISIIKNQPENACAAGPATVSGQVLFISICFSV